MKAESLVGETESSRTIVSNGNAISKESIALIARSREVFSRNRRSSVCKPFDPMVTLAQTAQLFGVEVAMRNVRG